LTISQPQIRKFIFKIASALPLEFVDAHIDRMREGMISPQEIPAAAIDANNLASMARRNPE
jgi:hypothetical protein